MNERSEQLGIGEKQIYAKKHCVISGAVAGDSTGRSIERLFCCLSMTLKLYIDDTEAVGKQT